MAFPVTLNGRTYTLADFEGTNYVDGFPDALESFVTHAGDIYNTTSTSSVAIGTGSKSFTTADSGKPYQAGTPLRIADAAAPETNFMDAIVTSYSGTNLVVDVFGYAGSGTKTSWTINIGGAKTVDGTLAVAQGGTGATTASDARTNLDVYSKADADSRFLNVSGEASNVTMTGDVTIGDTSADTLTVNATSAFTEAAGFGASIPASIDGAIAVRSDSDAHAISIYEPAGANENWQIGVNTSGDLRFYDSGSTTASITFQDGGGVGINIDTPQTYSNAPELVVDTGASGGITVKSSTTGYGALFFADGTTGNEQYRGFIQYNHNYAGSEDELQLGAGGAAKLIINGSSGQVKVGGTTNSPANVPMVVFATGNAGTAYDAGHTGIHINNEDATAGSGNFGAGLSFGRLGSSSDDQSAAIVPVQTTADEDHTGIAFFVHNTNTRANPLVEAARFTENGLHFNGDTAAANALDDYEEGTWTPTLSYGTATYNGARYIKIGRLVYAEVQISNFTDRSTAAAIQLGGLPFNSSSDNRSGSVSLSRFINRSSGTIVSYLGSSRDYFNFYAIVANADYQPVYYSHLSASNSNIYVCITYEAV